MVQAYIYSTKEVFHTGEGNFEKSNTRLRGYNIPRYLVVDWDSSGPVERTRKRLRTRDFLKNFGYVCSSYSSTFWLKLSKLKRIMSTIMCFMGI